MYIIHTIKSILVLTSMKVSPVVDPSMPRTRTRQSPEFCSHECRIFFFRNNVNFKLETRRTGLF